MRLGRKSGVEHGCYLHSLMIMLVLISYWKSLILHAPEGKIGYSACISCFKSIALICGFQYGKAAQLVFGFSADFKINDVTF